MLKDKVITKVIKGESIKVKYYDPSIDAETVIEGFVPYGNLPDNEVINYFNNNIVEDPQLKSLSIVERVPEKKKWVMPYQEFYKRMTMDISVDTEALQRVLSSFKK